MDIKQFEIFLLAVDLKSLTLAGAEAGYTQSGVSQIVKKLEQKMGFPLLHRLRAGVTPTDDAKRVIPALREIVKWGNQLDELVSSINGIETGSLRIASLSSISVHWLPHILKDFNARYKNISVKLLEGGNHELLDLLEEGRADIALTGNSELRSFEWIPLREDQLLAVLPLDHPMAHLTAFPMEAFQKESFITAPANIHSETHDLFKRHNITPNIRYTTTDDHTTLAFVEQGLGVSIVPGLMMEGFLHMRVKALELSPKSPRSLGIVLPSMKSASPAVKLFIDKMVGFVGQL